MPNTGCVRGRSPFVHVFTLGRTSTPCALSPPRCRRRWFSQPTNQPLRCGGSLSCPTAVRIAFGLSLWLMYAWIQ